MFFFKRRCRHIKWKITRYSNILQLDDMGYPLRLCIEECEDCKQTRQSWIDVPLPSLEQIKTGESLLLTWKEVE